MEIFRTYYNTSDDSEDISLQPMMDVRQMAKERFCTLTVHNSEKQFN